MTSPIWRASASFMPARAPRRSIWCRCSPSICSASTCNTSSASAVAVMAASPSSVARTNIDYQTSSAYLRNVTPMVEAGDCGAGSSPGVSLDEDGNPARDPTSPICRPWKRSTRCCTVKPRPARIMKAYQAFNTAGFARAEDGLPAGRHGARDRRGLAPRPSVTFSRIRNTRLAVEDVLGAYGQVTDGGCGSAVPAWHADRPRSA